MAKKFTLFFEYDIAKAEQRIVEGIASTDAVDNQGGVWNGEKYDGDIVDAGAIQEALGDYLKWGNIREMHQPSAVGVVLKAEVANGQFFISAKIEDETAWGKVKSRVYKGFSIGGKILKAVIEKLPDGRKVRRILKFLLSEISLVDRPANPEAEILVWKAEAFMDEEEKTPPAEEKPAVTPASIVAGIQALRNQAELEGDMEAASMYTQAIAMITQAKGEMMEAEAQSALEAEKVQKAGRPISTPRMAAMHKILKSLLEIMSEAGDELAVKMMGVYGPAPKEEQKGAGFDAGKLAEAIQKAMAGDLAKLAGAVEALAKSPVPGGPVTRPVDKQIGGGANEGQKPPSEADVLQKMYNETADPLVKARISEQLATVQLRNMFRN